MRKRIGNQFRESTARSGETVANNLPDLYPVEEWRAFYWNMNREGRLEEGRATLRLPQGVGEASPPVQIGQPGIVENVRRWAESVLLSLRGTVAQHFREARSEEEGSEAVP